MLEFRRAPHYRAGDQLESVIATNILAIKRNVLAPSFLQVFRRANRRASVPAVDAAPDGGLAIIRAGAFRFWVIRPDF
jgi:hypothetical protein